MLALTERLGVSHGGLSQRKLILTLPEVIRIALGDPRKVSLRGWRSLQEAYRRNPERVTQAAEAIDQTAYQELENSEVQSRLAKLIDSAKATNTQATKAHKKTLTSSDGSIAFEIRTDSTGRIKITSKLGLPESTRSKVESALEEILKGDSDQ